MNKIKIIPGIFDQEVKTNEVLKELTEKQCSIFDVIPMPNGQILIKYDDGVAPGEDIDDTGLDGTKELGKPMPSFDPNTGIPSWVRSEIALLEAKAEELRDWWQDFYDMKNPMSGEQIHAIDDFIDYVSDIPDRVTELQETMGWI